MITTRPRKEPIPVTELGANDVLVAHVGVGRNMSRQQLEEHVKRTRATLRQAFGETRTILIIPQRDLEGAELSVIRSV